MYPLTIFLNVSCDTFFNILHVGTCIISKLVHAEEELTQARQKAKRRSRICRSIAKSPVLSDKDYATFASSLKFDILSGLGRSIGQSSSPEVDLARFHAALTQFTRSQCDTRANIRMNCIARISKSRKLSITIIHFPYIYYGTISSLEKGTSLSQSPRNGEKEKTGCLFLVKKYEKSGVLKDFVYIWKNQGIFMEFKENLFLIIFLLHYKYSSDLWYKYISLFIHSTKYWICNKYSSL